MRSIQAGTIIVVLTGLTLVTIALRAEQTRCSAKVMALESRWVRIRQDQWAIESRTARLRSPDRLHRRLESIGSGLQLASPGMAVDRSVRLSDGFASHR